MSAWNISLGSLATTLTVLNRYYHETGFSNDSQPILEFAQGLCESLKSTFSISAVANPLVEEIDATLAELHHNLGCIGTETNQPLLTLKHFQIFNSMMIEKSGSETQGIDHWLHISWNELGNAYMMNKEWAEGEKAFRTSIASARLQPGFQLTDASFPYVNLGLALWCREQHQEANEVLLEGLHAREQKFGKDDKNSFM